MNSLDFSKKLNLKLYILHLNEKYFRKFLIIKLDLLEKWLNSENYARCFIIVIIRWYPVAHRYQY